VAPEDTSLLSAVAAVASALIALGALTVALFATKANRDSAHAAMRSAETAERVFALARQVEWKLTKSHEGGDRTSLYLLSNVGGGIAYGVEWSGASLIPRGGSSTDLTTVLPGEGVTFIDVTTLSDTSFRLVVEWFDDPECSGNRRLWKHDLF
jgi:hypothetical protein